MAPARVIAMTRPRVAIFSPNPVLTVTIEAQGDGDEIHLHPGGQGIWVARMAAELGADPILCGLAGGESGEVLTGLLRSLPGETRLVEAAGDSGCFVMDRRGGTRTVIASALAPPPSRHELDALFSLTCAAALECEVLVVCNPHPADALPLDVYSGLVTDAKRNGVDVLVDLSSPRLDHALEGGPNLVKLNDWELAQFVEGPVDEPGERDAAVNRLLQAGAGSVLVTRGERPAFAYRDGEVLEIDPPRFDEGFREGCGDTMMGAMAAARARGLDWPDSLILGTAAGAANFLRHGLGTGARPVVESLADRVELRPA
jgi:1-phosphofructokinase